MAHYRLICGEKCYLSPCEAQDADRWAAWLNDMAVAIPLGDEAYMVSSLERMQEDMSGVLKSHDPVFMIVRCDTDEPIGRCILFNINLVDRTAMLGIFIGEKSCWNQGYGQEACRLLLDYGFNLLNLNSVMLGVFAFNTRAIASYRKVGFVEIGRRRQARIIAGKAHDAILMDILADDFRAKFPSLLPTP